MAGQKMAKQSAPGCGYCFEFKDAKTNRANLKVKYSDGRKPKAYKTDALSLAARAQSDHLNVKPGDPFYIELSGPPGWELKGPVRLIISRAVNADADREHPYSPIRKGTFFSVKGEMNGNQWRGLVGTIDEAPPAGKIDKYEIAIAFSPTLPGVGLTHFSCDPEMDVIGS